MKRKYKVVDTDDIFSDDLRDYIEILLPEGINKKDVQLMMNAVEVYEKRYNLRYVHSLPGGMMIFENL